MSSVFPNPQGWLTPGFFARVRIPGSGRYQTLLIPDSAVVTDQNEKSLLVLGPDDVVQIRQVKLGALFGELRAVESGLTAADRVITNGQLQARPGAKVTPHEVPIAAKYLHTAPGSPTTQSLPAVGDESKPAQPNPTSEPSGATGR